GGLVAGVGTTAAARRLTRGRALDVGCITGRGSGGILRVLAETGVEIGNLLPQVHEFSLKVAEEGKESGLGGGRNQIPKLLGDGGLLRHAHVVGSKRPAGHVPRCEALPDFQGSSSRRRRARATWGSICNCEDRFWIFWTLARIL